LRIRLFALALVAFLCFICSSCSTKKEEKKNQLTPKLITEKQAKSEIDHSFDFDTTEWFEITSDMKGITLDIRYASNNNFTKQQIYPCGRCFFRPELGEKIKQLGKDVAMRYGMTLKIFDCYRPAPAQQKLWDIVPDARYVTPPSKGSMHNRGLAIDVTLINKEGKELDMGTAYDFFGIEAHTDNFNHSDNVLKNRKILKELFNAHGLSGIRTEWWHFSLQSEKAPLDSWEWNCD